MFPFTPWYTLSERKGFLRLKGTADKLQEVKEVAFIGTRQNEMSGSFNTAFEFVPHGENEEAGISVFQKKYFHYDLFITIRNNKKVAVLKKNVGDMINEVSAITDSGNRFECRVTFDPFNYYFFIRQNDQWIAAKTGIVNQVSTQVAFV
jgi:xylan 1,4-beta-xylosidase